jgi:hypothetical protein
MGDLNVQRLLIGLAITVVLGVSIGTALGYMWYLIEKRAIKANRAHTDAGNVLTNKDEESSDESNN